MCILMNDNENYVGRFVGFLPAGDLKYTSDVNWVAWFEVIRCLLFRHFTLCFSFALSQILAISTFITSPWRFISIRAGIPYSKIRKIMEDISAEGNFRSCRIWLVWIEILITRWFRPSPVLCSVDMFILSYWCDSIYAATRSKLHWNIATFWGFQGLTLLYPRSSPS